LYEIGKAAPRDEQKAVKYYRRAAQMGYGPAQNALKMLLRRNRTTKIEPRRQQDRLNSRTQAIPVPRPKEAIGRAVSATEVPMKSKGGTYVVPVLIDDTVTLDFVVDSGAAHVSIPADVVLTLRRAGKLTDADFGKKEIYRLADGSLASQQTFLIRSLKIGDRSIENVVGSIASPRGELLLGQSFLRRFNSWSIDNNKHVLILEPAVVNPSLPKAKLTTPNLTAMEFFQKGAAAYEAKDYSGAMSWWKLAADKGVTAAMTGIANMYHQGAGVNQDFVEALKWARLAAEKGDKPAMGMVAVQYAAGEGVTKDCVTARQWLAKAAAAGLQQANDYIRSGLNGLCRW
jgi:predicted aspartyl protease